MKKLLVVMLVLSMASMANAQLYLTINGADNPTDTIEALAGDVLTIDIYGDGDTNPSYFFMNEGSDDGQTYTWDISQAGIDYTGSVTDLQIMEEDIGIGLPYIYYFLDDVPAGTTPKAPLGPTPKPLIDTILLTVGLADGDEDSSGLSKITLYDLDLNILNETYFVHVTPEPITVALLGLGGLMLRRRK